MKFEKIKILNKKCLSSEGVKRGDKMADAPIKTESQCYFNGKPVFAGQEIKITKETKQDAALLVVNKWAEWVD